MDKASGKLTVYFEEPFWVGVFERIEDGKLSVAKDYEVQEYIQKYYFSLKFSPAVETVVKDIKRNPKRMQREAKKQTMETGIGTKSQQALKLQQEQNNHSIRELKRDENKILDTFLYEAIFIPEGVPAPSKDIINKPDLQVYVEDFGGNKGDLCLVAQVADEIVGAVWVRIMNDYGHIDNETPSFAISLLKGYRNYGIGTELMKQMLMKLKLEGYKQASLAVQKMNYAVRMYRKVGFVMV